MLLLGSCMNEKMTHISENIANYSGSVNFHFENSILNSHESGSLVQISPLILSGILDSTDIFTSQIEIRFPAPYRSWIDTECEKRKTTLCENWKKTISQNKDTLSKKLPEADNKFLPHTHICTQVIADTTMNIVTSSGVSIGMGVGIVSDFTWSLEDYPLVMTWNATKDVSYPPLSYKEKTSLWWHWEDTIAIVPSQLVNTDTWKHLQTQVNVVSWTGIYLQGQMTDCVDLDDFHGFDISFPWLWGNMKKNIFLRVDSIPTFKTIQSAILKTKYIEKNLPVEYLGKVKQIEKKDVLSCFQDSWYCDINFSQELLNDLESIQIYF